MNRFFKTKIAINDIDLLEDLPDSDKYVYLLFKDTECFSLAKLNGYQIETLITNRASKPIEFTLKQFFNDTEEKDFIFTVDQLREYLFILELESNRQIDEYFKTNNLREIEPILKDIIKGLYD